MKRQLRSGSPRNLSANMLLFLTAYVSVTIVVLILHFIEPNVLFWILLGLTMFIFIGSIYFFVYKIYFPIVKIEKAMQILESGSEGSHIDLSQGKSVYPIANKINVMLHSLKETMDREYTEKILKKQAEFEALQSQINPHFLYNTLESIRGQALVRGADEIADMTEALSTLFRYSISRKGNLVTLEEELRNVEHFLMIQQFRFNNKFRITKKIDDFNPEILKCKIPKLSLQPIVENAIYHGLETKMGNGEIYIEAYTTEKRLVITIKDDGVGIVKERLDHLNDSLDLGLDFSVEQTDGRSSGIALININQRIKIYFGDRYGITIASTVGQGTEVQMVLPVLIDSVNMSSPSHDEAAILR